PTGQPGAVEQYLRSVTGPAPARLLPAGCGPRPRTPVVPFSSRFGRTTMSRPRPPHLSRRTFLRLSLAMPAPLALASYGLGSLAHAAGDSASHLTPPTARAALLAPTPACGDADAVTPAETEGPYYKRDTPERTSLLEPGMAGTRLLLSGQVLTRDCRPVAAALLDFWQADAAGAYDNAGYRLRGHQFADEAGRYTLETVVPGLYPDRIFHPALVLATEEGAAGTLGTFDFVLNAG